MGYKLTQGVPHMSLKHTQKFSSFEQKYFFSIFQKMTFFRNKPSENETCQNDQTCEKFT